MSRIIGNGDSINFWHDKWYNNVSMANKFPLIFAKRKRDRCTLAQVWNHGNIRLFLSRGSNIGIREEKRQLRDILFSLNFSDNVDSGCWLWDSKGVYTVSSMYDFLNNGGVSTNMRDSIWPLKIPLKVKLFAWLAMHNKILTYDNLAKRGWSGEGGCVLCGWPESVDHLFVHCGFTSKFWSMFNNLNSWGVVLNLTSLVDIWDITLSLIGSTRNWCQCLILAFIWTVWKERNNKIFRVGNGNSRLGTYISVFCLFRFWTGVDPGFLEEMRGLEEEGSDEDLMDIGEPPVVDVGEPPVVDVPSDLGNA